MDYEQFAADLPANRRISFSSAEENEDVMQRMGIKQKIRQRAKGAFRADFAVIESNQATLTADRFAKSCSVYLEPPPNTVALLMFRSIGEKFLASGADVANEKLVVLRDGCGTELVSPNLAGSDAVVLPANRFEEMAQVLCPSCAPLEGVAIRKGDSSQLHKLRESAIQIMAGGRPSDEEVATLAAELIVWASYASGADRTEAIGRKTKSDVATQAQAYIEERFRESVSVEDLCRATGKQARTLQRCFTQYFDCTITDYLRMVRLSAVQRALSSAQPDEATVSSIALQSGFTHLGRFSVEYRQHFGESARETLLRCKRWR